MTGGEMLGVGLGLGALALLVASTATAGENDEVAKARELNSSPNLGGVAYGSTLPADPVAAAMLGALSPRINFRPSILDQARAISNRDQSI